jgi:beta-lactamase class A
MPDFFHIIPVGDDSVFNWVFQGKDTSLGLGFITYIGVFLSHTDHDTLVSWASNDGWEDSSWGVISGETGFAHAGAIVYNQSGYVFVTHFGAVFLHKKRT